MSITECPHCYRWVAPSASGECPSCGKNVTDVAAPGTQMRLLVVRGGESFPNICFNCAEPARHLVKVEVSNVDAATSVGRSLFSLAVPFGRIFSAFDAAKKDISLSLKLPICDACRKRKIKPELQSYDLEGREMRLVVHERFRDSVKRA
jgi:hypothetical protein